MDGTSVAGRMQIQASVMKTVELVAPQGYEHFLELGAPAVPEKPPFETRTSGIALAEQTGIGAAQGTPARRAEVHERRAAGVSSLRV